MNPVEQLKRMETMKRTVCYMQSIVVFLLIISTSLFGEEKKKVAQTGFQFLSVISDARASALAGAVTSLSMGSSGLFFNPAVITEMDGFLDVTASLNQWIADINHNAFSLAFKPGTGNWGVFGVSVQAVDYGEVLGTIVDGSNPEGYQDIGIIKPTALGIGLGYAKALSDRFSVGGQVRWVRQDLGESSIPVSITASDTTTEKVTNELNPLAFDFGTLFKTGIKSLTFGMSVRNFSKEIKYAEEGFQLPLVFAMGISMNMMDLFEIGGPEQSLYLSVDATHYRSHAEQLIVGVDYTLMKFLSIRGGYVSSNDEDGLNFGFGVSHFGLTIDYAYAPFGVFDNVQRMTVRFAM
jgi:hypothetical protein